MRLAKLIPILFLLLSHVATSRSQAQLVPYANAAAPISCSPAPCVLPPTQASEGGAEVADAPITTDPLSPAHMLLGSVDDNCPGSSASGFHTSTDGGSTWTVNCMPNLNVDGRVWYPGGQPMVAYDRSGTAYIADNYGDSEGLGFSLIGFQKSSDGVHWSSPAVALGGEYSSIYWSWLTVDTNLQSPYLDRLYVAGIEFMNLGAKSQLVVAHSEDGGAHWYTSAVYPPQGGLATDYTLTLAAGKDGNVYLTWQHCVGSGPAADCADGIAYMLFSKSVDGGKTWSRPSLITPVILANTACHCGISDLPNTNNIRVYNEPSIAVDNSSGPYSDNLYVSMFTWTGTYMRVVVAKSSDGGATWSKPVPVAPPSADHDQFFPWLSVGPTGLVGVSWLDRRNDPSNVNYQAFAAISKDGGQSFQPNVQLTTAFSNPNIGGEDWMGDYTGNTWAGPNYFIAAWMDSSNGVDMQDVIGGIRLH